MPEAFTAWLGDFFLLSSVVMFLGLAVLETFCPLRAATGPLVWRWTANIGFYIGNVLLFSFVLTHDHIIAWLGATAPVPKQDHRVRTVGEPMAAADMRLTCQRALPVHHPSPGASRLPLWRLHVVHHSDSELDASTGLRHYPVEAALHGLLGTAIFVGSGCQPGWEFRSALLAM